MSLRNNIRYLIKILYCFYKYIMIKLEKYKYFHNLDNQYKSDKFLALYYKMYQYMLSIPKEKIIIVKIVNNNIYYLYLFRYISCFCKSKDFYHWKERIYSLLTEKLGATNYRKYELLYRSKAKEFFNLHINNILKKSKETCIKKYNVNCYSQTEECKEKVKNTNKKKYNTQYYTQTEEFKEKSKTTSKENWGTDHPMQSKEIQDKMKDSWKNKTKENINEIINKRKNTCLEIYGKENVGGWLDSKSPKNHSPIADKICIIIDNIYGNPEDSMYAIKNGEFKIYYNNKKNYYAYDYCIPSKKIIVEVDDPYWHALDKDDNDIIKFPGGKLVLAKEIHKRDKEKEELAIQNGYKVYHIRDDEYRKDPKGTINKLIEEIKRFINAV